MDIYYSKETHNRVDQKMIQNGRKLVKIDRIRITKIKPYFSHFQVRPRTGSCSSSISVGGKPLYLSDIQRAEQSMPNLQQRAELLRIAEAMHTTPQSAPMPLPPQNRSSSQERECKCDVVFLGTTSMWFIRALKSLQDFWPCPAEIHRTHSVVFLQASGHFSLANYVLNM